MAKIISEEIIF